MLPLKSSLMLISLQPIFHQQTPPTPYTKHQTSEQTLLRPEFMFPYPLNVVKTYSFNHSDCLSASM